MSEYVCARCGTEAHSARSGRYYWGQVVTTFQEIWSKGRTDQGLPGYSKDQVHDVLVQIIYGVDEGPLGTRVRVSTRGMSKRQFAELVDKARRLAYDQYGAVIPEPN